MTRHARNNTAGAVYSYHERQRDTQTSGYGTQKQRLAKESIKDFDACNLTLQPCRHPVITPDGFLYDKEAIFEFIIHQKTQIARKLKEYEKQKKKDESELAELANAEQRSRTETFLRMEKSIVNSPNASTSSTSNTINTTTNSSNALSSGVGTSISNMSSGRDKDLPSFWIPSMTPQSNKTKVKRPDTTVYCPMSGKPLKANNLIDVHFTPASNSSNSKNVNYMCAVTHDLLSNPIPCAVIKTSGCVVTMECVEKLIKKDMTDPINGKKLKDDDIIPLQRGGTGYSSTNELEAAVKRPVMMA